MSGSGHLIAPTQSGFTPIYSCSNVRRNFLWGCIDIGGAKVNNLGCALAQWQRQQECELLPKGNLLYSFHDISRLAFKTITDPAHTILFRPNGQSGNFTH